MAGVAVVEICIQHAGQNKLRDTSLKGVYAVTVQERGDLKYSMTQPAAEETKDYTQVIASLKGIGLVEGTARDGFKDAWELKPAADGTKD